MKPHHPRALPLLVAALLLLAFSCKKDAPTASSATDRFVNLSHLNRLYQVVKLPNGAAVGTVAIYSEAPDYRLVADADEGFTCVDDVARAGLLLLHEPDLATSAEKQSQLNTMIEFVLQLQSPDGVAGAGYFYNFLLPPTAGSSAVTINKTGITSVAQANFWSWRAMWLLTEAAPTIQKTTPALAARMQAAVQKLTANVLREYGNRPRDFTVIRGVSVPNWLPVGSGSDQAAILLLSLNNIQQQSPRADVLGLMESLGAGIVAMQSGGAGKFPFGAILSFENTWHAYASDQAYALLRVGKALNKPDWQATARREIDTFYPYLIQQGFLESFEIEQNSTEIKPLKTSRFSQIAYGIRPMVWAALEAFDQTKDAKYADLAVQVAGWFLGKNPANAVLYDRATGRAYDGIGINAVVNKNAGAESTIETLWAFQRLEQYPDVLKKLF